MNKELYPISRRLVALANSRLSVKDSKMLAVIIDQLFIDLNRGHSCTNLTKFVAMEKLHLAKIHTVFTESELVANFDLRMTQLQAKPITLIKLENGCELLFITKYLHYELAIAKRINALKWVRQNTSFCECITILNSIKNKYQVPNIEQLFAIENSLKQKLSIITGGPGTGKTTTIMFLLLSLYQIYGSEIKIKICAPTGKAARRVQTSIASSLKEYRYPVPTLEIVEEFVQGNDNFMTIHRLLCARTNSIYFKYNKDNLLDLDVLIVDESSMVSLPLFSKLLQALDVDQIKHIIFLGDKNQLSSVEEGYVFATLVQNKALNLVANTHDLFTQDIVSTVSNLRLSNRNNGDVGLMAEATLLQDEMALRNILANSTTIKLYEPSLMELMKNVFNPNKLDGGVVPNIENKSIWNYLNCIKGLNLEAGLKATELYNKLLSTFNQQCILCLTKVGLLGSNRINQSIEKKMKQYLATIDIWYSGRPIIILENDYALGLNNGDIGFCVKNGNKVVIIFDNNRQFIPEVLPKYELAYAITIHKAQGSQYKHVNIVLSNGVTTDRGIELLSRELIYTAITRAHDSISIFSEEELLISSLKNVTQRNTGLSYLIV